MSLPPDARASYVPIIDSILAASDLNTISAKRIRKGLQAAVDYDITPYKDAITDLIMARFDKFNSDNAGQKGSDPDAHDSNTPPEPPAATTNGVHTEHLHHINSSRNHPSPAKKRQQDDTQDSDLSDVSATPSPNKKPKKSQSTEDRDAAYAARLQAEEDSLARATRGASVRKRNPVKKTTPSKKKKKSAAKVQDGDDSGIDGDSPATKREVNRTGGFHKPMTLSPPLAELLGETSLSRPQTVKKVWEYIKAHDLQDPKDKRQIRCDGAMRAVFKIDKVHMFTMNKYLNQNLYAQDE